MGQGKGDYFDDEADCFKHSDNINGAMCLLRVEVKFSRKCKRYYFPLTKCLEQANEDDQTIHTPYNLATLCY